MGVANSSPLRNGASLLIAVSLIASVVLGIHRIVGNAGPGQRPGYSPFSGQTINPRMDPRGHELEARRLEVERRFSQAVSMLNAREYEHAVTALHRVLELNPTLVEAHVNMGFAMLGLGQAKAAMDFFQGALVLRPSQANAHYGIALVLAERGDYKNASRAMENYLKYTHAGDAHRAKAQAAIRSWSGT